MFKNIINALKKHPVLIECIVGAVATAYLIFTMRAMLLFGTATLVHDNFSWGYPIFHLFAENIIYGQFPFWNPFSHAGEPFYPLIPSIRLLEPVTFLIIYIGRFISNDILMLFNWNRFVLSLIMVSGIYIVLRLFARNLFIKLTLIPILLYSSIMLGSFRQDGILNQFLWVPFITFFLLRILYYKDYRWHNWFMLGGLIGLNWQSYFFTGTWIFLLLFCLGVIFFYRNLLAELFQAKMIIFKLLAMIVIIVAMAMPNIALMLEKDKYVFPPRMVRPDYEKLPPQGSPMAYELNVSLNNADAIEMPYSLIAFTGTFSRIWDFIQIISPDGNEDLSWPGRDRWGKATEAYMYIGLLPWAIAILGIVAGKHVMKKLWLLILICFGLLMLGPPGGLHRLLYYVYPPMRFVRHTHTFVLFFVFALLYFYILGLNHIFSTWKSSLFHFTDSKQGIFSRLITNNKICNAIAILIFSASIIISFYWMTRLVYPATNYSFLFISLIFIVGWFLRKDLRKDSLYISLIVSNIVIVLIFTTNTFKFLRYILPVLGLPLIVLVIIKTRRNFSDAAKYYATIFLCVVFSMSLSVDLVYSLGKSSALYKGAKHPDKIFNVNTTPQPPFFSKRNRYIYPKDIIIDDGKELHLVRDDIYMGYLSFVYRESFVFSPIRYADYSDSNVSVKGILNELINKSFKDWAVSSEDNFLPGRFAYYQDGRNGTVEKYIGHDGVKEGSSSIILKPSSVGNSYIRYKISEIEELKGRHIRLSIWVKSQNKSPDAIQVYVEDDRGPLISRFYNNSGEWEQLLVGKYIDKNATELIITLNLKPTANMPAYFDRLNIEIVDIKTNTFEYALKSKRANSPFLLRKYFELINKDIDSAVLEEIFAVGKPIFEFKRGIVQVKENEFPDLLKRLGPTKSVKLLQKAIMLEDKFEPFLDKLKELPEEYVKKVENEKGFTYAIDKYNHNSFEMKIFAEEDGILYWADGYDSNWHAYIDGKEVPIYRANINFKAVGIHTGSNIIIFTYIPFWFKIGLYFFYAAFFISALPGIMMPIAAFLYEKIKKA